MCYPLKIYSYQRKGVTDSLGQRLQEIRDIHHNTECTTASNWPVNPNHICSERLIINLALHVQIIIK